MYMNKNKRILLLSAAILNIIGMVLLFVFSIIYNVNTSIIPENFWMVIDVLGYLLGSYVYDTIILAMIKAFAGILGSIFLLFAIRKKGKFFRLSQGFYVAGFIITIIAGGTLPWILIFISMFIPDVIIMNSKSELRQEDRMSERQQKEETVIVEQEYEDKKKRIEDLKRLRDNGIISEEEYKERLFEIL